MAELPRYKCHKEVRALKITSITFLEDDAASLNNGFLVTNPGFGSKFHGDDDLGYYVIYGDGYESWSPSKAFEEGYTLIQE